MLTTLIMAVLIAVLLIVAVLLVAAVAAWLSLGRRRRPAAVARGAGGTLTARIVDEPLPAVEPVVAPQPVTAHIAEPQIAEPQIAEPNAAEPNAAEPEIRWSLGFDPRSAGLDDTGRLRLIGDLGVIAKEWCVPLLCQAYVEERRPANRQAALSSLAACRSRAAIPTYRRALAAGDPAECAIATDALADLETTLAPSRTVIER